MDNHLISRAFSLYAELLQLHGQNERLADWLAGAAYRIRNLERPLTDLSKTELAEQFRPEIVTVINEGKKRGRIEALEDLIQLTPPGLFDLMRIKGWGVINCMYSGRRPGSTTWSNCWRRQRLAKSVNCPASVKRPRRQQV